MFPPRKHKLLVLGGNVGGTPPTIVKVTEFHECGINAFKFSLFMLISF